MVAKEFEYDQLIGKAMLASLGYSEKETLPLLTNRLIRRAGKIGANILDSNVTMVRKADDNTAHLVTFATLEMHGTSLPVIHSAFGKINGRELKLDDADKALIMPQNDFNRSMLRKHPAEFMLQLQEFTNSVSRKPAVSEAVDPEVEKTARTALRDLLQTYGAAGVPLDKCDA